MLEQFAVPDWGIDEIIAADPNTYIIEWTRLMKDGDCVIAIQRRKANAIGRAMFSQGFSNEQVWKAYNIARVACGLPEQEMPTKNGRGLTPRAPDAHGRAAENEEEPPEYGTGGWMSAR